MRRGSPLVFLALPFSTSNFLLGVNKHHEQTALSQGPLICEAVKLSMLYLRNFWSFFFTLLFFPKHGAEKEASIFKNQSINHSREISTRLLTCNSCFLRSSMSGSCLVVNSILAVMLLIINLMLA